MREARASMGTRSALLISALAALLAVRSCDAASFSSRLIHRFSDEMKAVRGGSGQGEDWPEKGTAEYYRRLLRIDLGRRLKTVGSQSGLMFPVQGSSTKSFGNDFGWLHYTWIDVGMPHVSFLVALDSGSDLLWVPCDCMRCAPLSASNYISLDRDLNEYSISDSNTSKVVPCSHRLCELGPNCKSPKHSCPYTVNYYSDNLSTSGYLVEDVLHLASRGDDASNTSVQVSVIIGCGRNQSGDFLDGVAPDGLMGLGLGKISVPSILATAGMVEDAFSLCFGDDDSGRIFFGDKGSPKQQSTQFLPVDGIYTTYIVGVKAACIGSLCAESASFKALVDSGTSFTYLPGKVYESVVMQLDSHITAVRYNIDGTPWEYCYKSSSLDLPKIPSVKLMFAFNNSFVVHNPYFTISEEQDVVGFCLAIQPTDGEIGIIGQNFMTGYRMVFDREKLQLGWSRSNCTDLTDSKRLPLNHSANGITKPLAPNERQSARGSPAVGPAIAGRAPSAAASMRFSMPTTYALLVRCLLPFACVGCIFYIC